MSEEKREEQIIENYAINAQLLQDVLNYLADRPFKESNPLIHRIQTTIKPIKITDTPKEPDVESKA